MKIKDLLAVVTEYTTVIVINAESWEEIARYDGRNAIPEEMNDEHIITMEANDKAIIVEI